MQIGFCFGKVVRFENGEATNSISWLCVHHIQCAHYMSMDHALNVLLDILFCCLVQATWLLRQRGAGM